MIVDEAAVTLRMRRFDPDMTCCYDIGALDALCRPIREAMERVERLREVLAEGWDVGPELAHEEKLLAALEDA